MNPKRVLADLLVFARGYFRNPVALFFSLIFPIILIGLFGLIFSTSGASAISLYTQNFDHHSNVSVEFLQALNATGAVKISMVSPSQGNLSTWLGQNGDPVGLVIPAGFASSFQNRTPVTVTVFTNPQDAASSGIALGAVTGVINGFNLQAAGGKPILMSTELNVGSQVFTYIDYLVPGLIGFSILTSPMFSMVEISADYRKNGIFRQLSLTPLTKAEWLSAKIIWYIILTMISAVIMISFGTEVFHAHTPLTFGILPFLILGPLFFVSLGMLAGSVARTPESAAVIGNLITFPMMFLAGTFFPVSSFSPPLQTFAHVLPLYYVIDGMNQVILFSNTSRAFTDGVVILLGSAVVFVLAILTFKWRDE